MKVVFWNQVVHDLTGGGKLKQKYWRSIIPKVEVSKGWGPGICSSGVGFLWPSPAGPTYEELNGGERVGVFVVKVFVFYVSLHSFVFDSHFSGCALCSRILIIFGNDTRPMLVKQFKIKCTKATYVPLENLKKVKYSSLILSLYSSHIRCKQIKRGLEEPTTDQSKCVENQTLDYTTWEKAK